MDGKGAHKNDSELVFDISQATEMVEALMTEVILSLSASGQSVAPHGKK